MWQCTLSEILPPILQICQICLLVTTASASLDGWTKNDLIYVWKGAGALQFAGNLSLPGGFKMANSTNKYCDVKTATGNNIRQEERGGGRMRNEKCFICL